MRLPLIFSIQLWVTAGCLAALSGCAPLLERIPAPPAVFSGVDLTGPYDADLPPARIEQIKRAGLAANWAVPYIFLSIAGRFEADGDEKRSIAFYDRAVLEFRKRGNLFGEGTAWRKKWAALQRFGHPEEALKSLLDMEPKTSKTPLAAFVLSGFGHYHAQNGQYGKAMEYFRRVLDEHAKEASNPDLMALKRDVSIEYGMALLAVDYFPAVASRLFLADLDERFLQDIRHQTLASLSNLEVAKNLCIELRRSDIARYFPEIAPVHLECDIENYLGLLFGIRGETDKAVYHLGQADAIAKSSGYHLGRADGVFFLNQVYLLNHNRVEGKQSAHHLENMADQYQLFPYVLWAKMILAHHNRWSGDVKSALKSIMEFLDILEKTGSWCSRISDFRRIDSFQPRMLRREIFDLSIRQRDEETAFLAAEKIKASDWCDLFRSVTWQSDSVEASLIQKLQDHREQAEKVYRKLVHAVSTPAQFLKVVQSAHRIHKDFANRISDMKSRYPRLYHLIFGDVPRPREIQKRLDLNTTLFSYYSTNQELYVWVISQKGIYTERIKISADDLETAVLDYRRALTSRDRSRIDAFAEKIYEHYLKPVIPFTHGDRMVIIPHGALHELPFATMRYVKSYLVEVFNVVYMPHAGILGWPDLVVTPPSSKRVLVVESSKPGDDASVVKSTASLLQPLPKLHLDVVNVQAYEKPKDALMKWSEHYDVIYFNVKCRLSEVSPLHSGFLLSSSAESGSNLTISDLCALSVKSRLSLVSACLDRNDSVSSAIGRSLLAQALMYASSHKVLMPLWSVDEKSRVTFLKYFYKYFEKNEDAEDALKEAQNEMMTAGFGPQDWAAFVLYGRP